MAIAADFTMSLVLHIARKDLSRVRVALSVCAGLAGFSMVMSYVLGAYGHAWIDVIDVWILAMGVPFLALSVLPMGIIASIVHEDRPTGYSAQWMTRPVSGARMLAAKLLGAGMVLVFISSAEASVGGVFGAAWGPAFSGFLLINALLAVAAFGVAAFTPSPALFWPSLIGLGVFMQLMLVPVALRAKATGFLMMSHVYAAAIIWVGTILLTVTHQYRTRRVRRSVGIAATGMALTVGAVFWLPSGLHRLAAPRPTAAEQTSFKVQRGRVFLDAKSKDGPTVRVHLTATVTGEATSLKLVGLALESTEGTNGAPVGRSVLELSHAPRRVFADDALLGALGLKTGMLREQDLSFSHELKAVAPSWKRQEFFGRGLQARTLWSTYEAKTAVRVPLHASETFVHGVKILRTSYNPVGTKGRQSTSYRVEWLERPISSLGDDGTAVFTVWDGSPPTAAYALFNEKTGELARMEWSGHVKMPGLASHFAEFVAGQKPTKIPEFQLDDAWVREAVLVKVAYHYRGTVERVLPLQLVEPSKVRGSSVP